MDAGLQAASGSPAPALPHAPAGGPNNVVDLTADPVADEERAVSDGEAAESAVAAGAGADAGAGVGAPGGGAGPDGPGPRAHAPPATASPAKSSTGKRPREEDGSDDDDGHDQVRHPAPHLLPAAAPWAVHRWTRTRVHRWTRKHVHRWTRKRVGVRPGACGSPERERRRTCGRGRTQHVQGVSNACAGVCSRARVLVCVCCAWAYIACCAQCIICHEDFNNSGDHKVPVWVCVHARMRVRGVCVRARARASACVRGGSHVRAYMHLQARARRVRTQANTRAARTVHR